MGTSKSVEARNINTYTATPRNFTVSGYIRQNEEQNKQTAEFPMDIIIICCNYYGHYFEYFEPNNDMDVENDEIEMKSKVKLKKDMNPDIFSSFRHFGCSFGKHIVKSSEDHVYEWTLSIVKLETSGGLRIGVFDPNNNAYYKWQCDSVLENSDSMIPDIGPDKLRANQGDIIKAELNMMNKFGRLKFYKNDKEIGKPFTKIQRNENKRYRFGVELAFENDNVTIIQFAKDKRQ